MANLAGFSSADYGAMLNHYTRHDHDPDQTKYTYKNQKIDPKRTHLNYSIFEREDLDGFIKNAIEGVTQKPKLGTKATNVLSDWIVTLPADQPLLEGREREFFQAVYDYLVEQVGEDRLVGAFVHMDESAPHMHFAFVPVAETTKMTNDKTQPLKDKHGRVKKDRKGTVRYKRIPVRDKFGNVVKRSSFSQSKLFGRKELAEFHPNLEAALEKHFGFVCGIQLSDPGEKVLSKLDQPDYIKAKATLAAQQEQIKENEAKAREAERAEREARERARAAQAELDRLMREIEDKGKDKEKAEREAARAQTRLEGLQQRCGEAQEECARLAKESKGAEEDCRRAQVSLDDVELEIGCAEELVGSTGRAVQTACEVVQDAMNEAVERHPEAVRDLLRGWQGTGKESLLSRVLGGLERVWERITALFRPNRGHVGDWVPAPQKPARIDTRKIEEAAHETEGRVKPNGWGTHH